MRLLLDTHAFLWFIDGSDRLSSHACELIEDTANERLLSVGSLWEMAIKASLGRLTLRLSFTDLVSNQVLGNEIQLLPIRPAHLDVQKNLSFHHRDPFDRLIIAQSIAEGSPCSHATRPLSHILRKLSGTKIKTGRNLARTDVSPTDAPASARPEGRSSAPRLRRSAARPVKQAASNQKDRALHRTRSVLIVRSHAEHGSEGEVR